MSASFWMSDLVTLGDTHVEFFQVLGLPAPPVMTAEQFKTLVRQAEGTLVLMMSEPGSDPVFELLSRRILDDLVEHLQLQ